MADNYFQPVNNHFAFDAKLEDIDDNEFLNKSRSRPSNNGNDVSNISRSSPQDGGPVREQHQLYEQKRREIEERSLQSTQRSLGLLYETEEVGTATAVELAKQREQLERTNKNLDDINASLRYSQKHLNGIKSVFSGIKNYFSGQATPAITNSERKLSNDSHNSQRSGTDSIEKNLASPNEKYDQHPISRIREDSTSRQQQSQQTGGKPFEQQLEANLNEMADNLSRLKGLATELGTEIETQNELLDNMNYKIEDVDIKLSRQNKDMVKLLGKK